MNSKAMRWILLLLGFLASGQAIAQTLTPEDEALFRAISRKEVEQIRELLQKGAHLEAVKDGRTPLMTAACFYDPAMTLELLRAGANPNANVKGKTPLDAAVKGQSRASLEALVKGGADPRRLEDGGAGLLAAAALHPPLIPPLLAAGATTPLFQDRSILERAAGLRNPRGVADSSLLESLLVPGEREKYPGEPLRLALAAGDLQLTKDLLRAGIPPDGRTKERGTPLLAAVGMSSTKGILLLLDAGADIQRGGFDNRTPLVVAVDYENPEKVELLLARGAKVDYVPARRATTALGEAASRKSLPMVRLLLQHGADPNLRDDNGRAPLENVSTGASRGEVVAELLAHGAHPQKAPADAPEESAVGKAAHDCDGAGVMTLLAAGAAREDVPSKVLARCWRSAIQELHQAGFDFDPLDARGTTVLQEAAALDDPEQVVRLLQMGADPDIRDTKGRTALHRAAELERRKAISLLAGAGADPDARDREGNTPGSLYWKRVNHHPRTAGDWPTRFSFVLPGDFKYCGLPVRDRKPGSDDEGPRLEEDPPGLDDMSEPSGSARPAILFRCSSKERIMGVIVAQVPPGTSIQSLGPSKGMTLSEASWHGKTLPIGHYRMTGMTVGVLREPEVWIAVVPGSVEPFLVQIWAPQEYGAEAGWILRGLLGTMDQPSITDQFLSLNMGWILLALVCSLASVALLGAGALWLVQKIWPGLRPSFQLTPERRRKP